jgi:hypothetical protein
VPAVFRYARTFVRVAQTLQRVRLPVTAAAPANTASVFNLTSSFGNYARVGAREGVIRFAYSHFPTPPFEFEGNMTGTSDATEPRFTFTARQHLYLVYTRAATVWERLSTDDGKTWTGETSLFGASRRPDITCSPDGTILRAAYEPATGKIQATRQYPGDPAASAPFYLKDSAAVDLIIADDSFRIVAQTDGLWGLHVLLSGGGSTSLYHSSDDGESWFTTSGAVTGITSGTHPGMAAGHDGTLWAWAHVAGVLKFTRRYPGDTDWSAPATVLDQTAANLTVKDIPSSMALAWEGPQRLLLATIYSTHVGPSDWWSATDGADFRQFT